MEMSASPFGVAGFCYGRRPAKRSGTLIDADPIRPYRDLARSLALGVFLPMALWRSPAQGAYQSESDEALSPAQLMRLVQALMAAVTGSGDPDPTVQAAAAAFTRAVQDIEAQRAQGSLTNEQSAEKIRAAWDEFENESRLVLLKVVAHPDGCTRQWRPLFGGQWTAMSEDGALVGIGVNQVRVFRDGYTPVVENVTTDSDLTKTYRLVPSSD